MGEAVATGRFGRVSWTQAGDYLWLAITAPQLEGASLQSLTREAYLELLACARKFQFPRFVRLWNYLDGINRGEGDNENYRQFCLGRYQAFLRAGVGEEEFPAASALGRRSSNLLIYGLATRQLCQHLENPVQTSAYEYPREYGHASPSFARATLSGGHLFISGTASILKSRSLHVDDVVAQTQLSCQNIEQVLKRAQSASGHPWTMDLLKIYVRRPGDKPGIAEVIQRYFPQAQWLWLQADICREELLVEIEGVAVRDMTGE